LHSDKDTSVTATKPMFGPALLFTQDSLQKQVRVVAELGRTYLLCICPDLVTGWKLEFVCKLPFVAVLRYIGKAPDIISHA
jgi:hypothetical protein